MQVNNYVYRYLLTTHNRKTVSLAEEVRFTEAYLYLEDIRFGEALQVCISGDTDMERQTKVIKHNIATPVSPLIIRITIKKEGITVTNNLQLRTYTATKNGMGLANLRKQFAMHGKELTIKKTEEKFVAIIPFL